LLLLLRCSADMQHSSQDQLCRSRPAQRCWVRLLIVTPGVWATPHTSFAESTACCVYGAGFLSDNSVGLRSKGPLLAEAVAAAAVSSTPVLLLTWRLAVHTRSLTVRSVPALQPAGC
jgi:hypothetical protein